MDTGEHPNPHPEIAIDGMNDDQYDENSLAAEGATLEEVNLASADEDDAQSVRLENQCTESHLTSVTPSFPTPKARSKSAEIHSPAEDPVSPCEPVSRSLSEPVQIASAKEELLGQPELSFSGTSSRLNEAVRLSMWDVPLGYVIQRMIAESHMSSNTRGMHTTAERKVQCAVTRSKSASCPKHLKGPLFRTHSYSCDVGSPQLDSLNIDVSPKPVVNEGRGFIETFSPEAIMESNGELMSYAAWRARRLFTKTPDDLEVPVFQCPICLENEPIHDSLEFTCGHFFCRVCTLTYITTRIQDGIVDITCPYIIEDGEQTKACGRPVEIVQLLRMLGDHCDAEWKEKFTAFHDMKDPNMRSCPRCDGLTEGSPLAPRMICLFCGVSYCFTHSLAHDDSETCQQYEERIQKKEEATKALIKSTCKRCPSCNCVTYKYEGCNHMTCRCGHEWCWLCGSNLVGTVANHYSPANVFSQCSGMQFIEASGGSRRVRAKKLIGSVILFCISPAIASLIFVGLILTLIFAPIIGFLYTWFKGHARCSTDFICIPLFLGCVLLHYLVFLIAVTLYLPYAIILVMLSPLFFCRRQRGTLYSLLVIRPMEFAYLIVNHVTRLFRDSE